MNNHRSVQFFDKNSSSIIEIDPYYENYYIKKGYQKLKYRFSKYIYFKFIRFPKSLFQLLKNVKIIFKNPTKSDYVIYDDKKTQYIKMILKNCKIFILPSRLGRIKEIYVSAEIIKFVIKNFFRFSLKQNYLSAMIYQIAPKIVITHIDNSVDFSVTTKIFEKTKIKFIAIQNSQREGEDLKNLYFDSLFVFGEHYKNLYQKKKVPVKKFHISGSLKTNFIKKILEKKYSKFDENKFDICLISEPMLSISGDFSHIKNYADLKGKVAKHTVNLCEEKNLNLVFSGKYSLESEYFDFEKIFYNRYLNGAKFNISQGFKKDLNSYLNIMQSKLIIGVNSTMLQESIFFNKKILSCPFISHPDFNLSFPDECVLKEDNYDAFKHKVLKILSVDKDEYLRKLSDKFDYIMRTDFDFYSELKKYEN